MGQVEFTEGQAERPWPTVADRVAIDADDRQQLDRGAGHKSLARRLGLGHGERPLDQAVALAADDVEDREPSDAVQDRVVGLTGHGGAVFDIIRREGYRLVERPFTVAEAKTAREAFVTSTAVELLPVVRIDGDRVGDGRPGPLSRALREFYLAHAAAA